MQLIDILIWNPISEWHQIELDWVWSQISNHKLKSKKVTGKRNIRVIPEFHNISLFKMLLYSLRTNSVKKHQHSVNTNSLDTKKLSNGIMGLLDLKKKIIKKVKISLLKTYFTILIIFALVIKKNLQIFVKKSYALIMFLNISIT